MVLGRVRVNVHFLRSSLARGCLLILSQVQYTGYFAIKKESGKEVQSIHIENLPEGEYIVRGYDMESDGLPYHPTPAVVHYFTIHRGSTLQNQSECMIANPHIFAGGASNICINYTLAMGYVYVVLHPVNDLSSITVKNINFTSQQEYCIHVGGEDIFSVVVFEWTSNNFQPTTVVNVSTFYQPIATSTIAEVPTRNEPGESAITASTDNSINSYSNSSSN